MKHQLTEQPSARRASAWRLEPNQPRQFNRMCSRRRRGVTILETALIFPLLMFLTMGLVQYGIIMNATSVVTNVTRDGARYAAIHAFDGTAAQADAATRAYIRTRLAGTTINTTSVPDSAIAITVANRAPGEQIRVSVTYPLSKKMFLPNNFFGYQIFHSDYTTSSTMLIEGIN